MATEQQKYIGELHIAGHEHLGDLRPSDLIANLAKVARRDTARVMIATAAVSHYFGLSLETLVGEDYDGVPVDGPNVNNVSACSIAYAEFIAAVKQSSDPMVRKSLEALARHQKKQRTV